ncbi:heparan-sulfate 6-O-sulfotransferase 2-like [Artemia franciscana]|uniref:heparan-sulfate 6-O-sulfotransferase 2-like n=1 Tax=Artemia franciscana TaxID=6661 RepID=UPI0032DA88B3
MVVLHIQKTGGRQFEIHLVKDLDLERPCVCQQTDSENGCNCLRPGKNRETWLFSRLSIGWKFGLHADWTELTECLDTKLNQIVGKRSNRRKFYITILRDPLSRFLSEFRHVQRGATWKHSRHSCDHRLPTEAELPRCYGGHNWTDVTLENFMSCPYNLAINRQTRMLADLKVVECYNVSAMNKSQRDAKMLASAKLNLSNMSFFGLTEQQEMNQYIFERTFGVKFLVPFEQQKAIFSSQTLNLITEKQKRMVLELNHLDVELYEYALKLFNYRFSRLKSLDASFEGHFPNTFSSNGRSHITQFMK